MKTVNRIWNSILGATLLSMAHSHLRAESLPLKPTEIKKAAFEYFVDDYLIENRFDQKFLVTVRPFVHKGIPDPHNPVMIADKPWEIGGLIGPASVIYDQEKKLFRAYYCIYRSPDKTTPYRTGYAESDDGIHWKKPELSQFLWNQEKTNIVFQGETEAVVLQILDLPDSAKKGFAFLGYYVEPGGGYLAGSQDGIEWKKLENIIPSKSDCQHSIVYDEDRQEYITYFRNVMQFKQVADNPKSGTTRIISRLANKALFEQWKGIPASVILPEENDAVLFYGMTVAMKNRLYIGFLEQFELYPHEVIDIELRTSRDGITWKGYPPGQYMVDRGSYGEWNGGMVKPAGLVEYGDEWLFYYTGYTGYHDEVLSNKGAAMGLLRFRKEGFVSMRSHDFRLSYIITRPLVWNDGELLVNFDGTGVFPKDGFLKVQVTDIDRKVIEGFSYDECVEFRGDDVRAPIKWKNAQLSNLAGKVIRLEFQYQYGDLYGFVSE